jgi:hypothetical protein
VKNQDVCAQNQDVCMQNRMYACKTGVYVLKKAVTAMASDIVLSTVWFRYDGQQTETLMHFLTVG